MLRLGRTSGSVAAAILVLMGFPSTVHAATSVDIADIMGYSAIASFESVDLSGCIITDVFVFGSVGSLHTPPGGPQSTQRAGVAISQFDSCRSVLLLTGLGSTQTLHFPIDNGLGSASLIATIPVDEFVSGTTFNVRISLTWSATSDLVHTVTNTNLRLPGLLVKTHFNGDSREAEASGTVTAGSTNYTPVASTTADLDSSQNGQITIQQ